jgi:hypothetical protein
VATKVAEVADATSTTELEKASADTATTMANIQAELAEFRTELAAEGAVMAAAPTADKVIHAGLLGNTGGQ